ncbi:MAG TPA: hypothetical protein VK462_00610 [Nitrososphaeraceae archaeon]|nr:hypothetical protein [Nitrososphaeraceae archaeon]
MKINKYYPFAFVYFFINAVGLPLGMLYTTLLTPLFYGWLVLKGKGEILFKFFVFFTPFIIIHLINGVDKFAYVKSTLLFLTVYIFGFTFYTLITSYLETEKIFRKLLITNFILTVIALLFVFTRYRFLFWSDYQIEAGGVSIEHWPRLAMFTYEPSYYSTLLVPIFAYYFTNFITKQTQRNGFDLLMIIFSLVLSLSMGVISGLAMSISFLVILNAPRFLASKKLLYSISAIVISLILAFIVLVFFYPENPFFVRITAIMGGGDTSAKGRTYEAFYLAFKIAHLKSTWWGIGQGQIKIIGDSVIKEFYDFPLGDTTRVAIPCAFAETIATFGVVGACIRLFVEVYLFFKTKVLTNYYRTLLFFFVFVYQFTGSFNTNIAEYVIWILAFTNLFPQFDKASAISISGPGNKISKETTQL